MRMLTSRTFAQTMEAARLERPRVPVARDAHVLDRARRVATMALVATVLVFAGAFALT